MSTNAVVKRRTRKKEVDLASIVIPIITLLIILTVLELIARYTGISRFILPPPSEIIYQTATKFIPDILPHFLFTLKVIVVGFAIAVVLGMLLAALFSQFSFLVKAATPIIIWLVITPMITLIPLIMLWLGTEPDNRIIVVIIQATPIIALNTLTGFTTVELDKYELVKSVGATKLQAFTKITFMNAMPQVFTGVKLGCIFSTIGAISADFVAGTCGLGFRILQYTKYNMTDLSYGCIIIIALIGLTLYNIVDSIEKRVVLWKK
jgi:ABC-type nitrate/sulfonate/bicarbonate transport system permease component